MKKKRLEVTNHEQIRENIGLKSVCIAGLGHIGVPLIAHFLKKQIITGYDINQKKIRDITKLKLSFFEPGLNSLLDLIGNDRIRLVSDINKVNANVYVICIGQDVLNNNIKSNNIKNCLKSII